MLLGVFVANADVSLVIASSQHIASEFQQLSHASWLVTSYGLAQSASQPLYGKLSDTFGRKSNLITAYILFTGGIFLCGSGQVYWQLLLGRVISGIGGAGMTAIVSM
jgi:MFS family permease